MARDLRIQLILDTLDKASAPLKSISSQSTKAAKALKDAKDAQKQLNKELKTAEGLQELEKELGEATAALAKNKAAIDENRQAHAAQKAVHHELTSELKAATKRFDEMSKAIIKGENVSQEYRDELERNRFEMTLLQKQVDQSSRTLKGYTDSIGKAEKKVGKLTTQEKHLNTAIDEHRTKLTNAGISINNLSDTTDSMRRRMETSTQAIERQQAALEKLQKREQALERTRKRIAAVKNAGTSMMAKGAGMTATGVAAGWGISNGMQSGIDYGAQKSAVQAITRLQANDPRLKALHDQSAELGATTSFTSTEVAQGQEFLARAGYSPEAIKASMKDVLDLSKANRIELARAADIASNISGAFRIDPEAAGSMQRVADILSATTTRANVDLEMLGETMKYLGQASGLDMSLEQAAAMAGLLGNIGIQGSEAGTTMRAMMNRLAAPVGPAQDALQELNVTIADSAGNMRQIPDILADINRATSKMGNVARASYLKDIFGEEPGSGMALLIEQQGQAGVDKFASILKAVKGENAQIAKVMADNIKGDLDGLSSSLESVSNIITDTNNGPLRELIQLVTQNVRNITGWMKANPELTRQLFQGAVAVAGITVALGLLATGIGLVTWTFGQLIPVILGIGKAFAWVGRLLLANPILAIITAIAAAAYLIYDNWDAIGSFFKQVWEGIKAGLKRDWDDIMGVLDKAQESLARWFNAIGERWDQFKAKTKEVFSAVPGFVMDGLQRLEALFNKFSGPGILFNLIKAGMAKLGVDLPEIFTAAGKAMISSLTAGLRSAFPDAMQAITELGDNISNWFTDKLGIHSPSRVFVGHGYDVMRGLERGLDQHTDLPMSSMVTLRNNLNRFAFDTELTALPTLQPPAMLNTSMTTGGAMASTISVGDINIYAAVGQDEQSIALQVRTELERLAREQRRQQRTIMRDSE